MGIRVCMSHEDYKHSRDGGKPWLQGVYVPVCVVTFYEFTVRKCVSC